MAKHRQPCQNHAYLLSKRITWHHMVSSHDGERCCIIRPNLIERHLVSPSSFYQRYTNCTPNGETILPKDNPTLVSTAALLCWSSFMTMITLDCEIVQLIVHTGLCTAAFIILITMDCTVGSSACVVGVVLLKVIPPKQYLFCQIGPNNPTYVQSSCAQLDCAWPLRTCVVYVQGQSRRGS